MTSEEFKDVPEGALVLLLDDALATHERVRIAFAGTGINLHVTDSWVTVKQAVFSDTPPDLLILDLKMPSIDGAAVGKAIKRRLSIPIVIYSSEDAWRLADAQKELGAEAAVSKSGSEADLVRAVQRCLRIQALQTRVEGVVHNG